MSATVAGRIEVGLDEGAGGSIGLHCLLERAHGRAGAFACDITHGLAGEFDDSSEGDAPIEEGLDGGLVGGASLDANSFAAMVRAIARG